MTPEEARIIFAFLAVFALRDLRDGILWYRLLGRALDVTPPGPSPPPKPVPPGPVPPVPVPDPVPPKPVARTPRFTNITATSFAGLSDDEESRTSAYPPNALIESNKPGVALPLHFAGTRPVVRVFANGKFVDCPIVDVGPWNTHDPYWATNTRPLAEAQHANKTTAQNGRVPTQAAGIDLTPGAWSALGFTGNLDAITATVSWDFVDYLGASPAPTPPVTGLVKNVWPTQAEAESFFGNPASAGWEAANLVYVSCPWTLTVEGTKSNRILIHKKAAASLTRILNYIWAQCGQSQAQIEAFGYHVMDGSYNYRNIAGSSSLSQHAYGAAIDWNAAANPQHAPISQTKFKPDSLIVFAFEFEGWSWGGRWSPASVDAMHTQLLRVR